MFAENFPLVEQGRREEAGQFSLGSFGQVAYLPRVENYAKHEATAQYVQNILWPLAQQVRADRSSLEQEWRDIRAMNQMTHTSGRRYFGRSDYYLPVYRRERSKLVSALSRGLFPSDDYFDCIDESTSNQEGARIVKSYMYWEMERNARIRSFVKTFLGNLIDYGIGIMKHWYRRQLVTEGQMRRNAVGEMQTRTYSFAPRSREGGAVSSRSPFFFYVYPVTAETLDEALMTFEDIDVTAAYCKEMERLGRWVNVKEAAFASVPEHDTNRDLALFEQGLNTPSPGIGGDLGEVYTTTEIWTCMVLPPSAYLPWEDTKAALPVRIVCIGGVPMEVTRNPFFHQRPPYAVARIDQIDGLFYGSAAGRTIKPLQLLANDLSNQINDNGIYAMNPIPLINPAHIAGPIRPLAPGVPWYVSDVDKAVRFERPPFEQVQYGTNMLQFTIGMGQDSGGAPPDRATMSRGAKTATGMQILQKNAVGPLQDVVEDVEIDGMVPILFALWKNAVQYRDASVMVKVAGSEEMVQIDPEMLAIEAQFSWKASSQAVNNQMRSQQALGLIQAVMPLMPILAQQGYVVDFAPLIRKVYSDGMGFRGFTEFIRRGQAAGPGMGPPPPGAVPGVAAEQQDLARSALAQTYGGDSPEAEPVPGEADDFGAVRQQADALAAMQGGGGLS